MNNIQNEASGRKVVIETFAVIGFITIMATSLWLAIYSTRFVPTVVTRIGSAVVYLGSVFTPTPHPSLSVVSTATTTPFGEASSTLSTASTTLTTPATTVTTPSKNIPTVAGTKTNTTYQIGSSTPAVPHGLPDFVVQINAVGYLATTSADSFVASSTVPNGSRPAVTFTIKNIGTGVSGPWRFSASIPTETAFIYQSQPQQPLSPGDSIDYTLGFDQANRGAGKLISITANFDHAVAESNPDNNSASAQITILGN